MNEQDSTTDPLSDQALPPWIKLHHGHVFHALPYGTLKRDPDAFLAYWLLVEANILTGPIYGSVTVAAELLGVRQETLERVIRVGAAISAEGMVQVSWAVMARNGGLKLRRTKQSNRKGNVDDRSTIVERSSHDRSTVASSLLLSEKSTEREEETVQPKNPKEPKTPRKETSGPNADVIRHFESMYEKCYGQPYAFQGGKDGAHVKRLLSYASGDVARVKAKIDLAFQDSFRRDTIHVDLGVVVSGWNRLVNGSKPPPPPERPPKLYATKQGAINYHGHLDGEAVPVGDQFGWRLPDGKLVTQ